MNMQTPIPTLSLTTEQLAEWADQKADAQQEMVRLQKVIDETTKKLDAARMLFGDDAINSLIQEAEELAVDATTSVVTVVATLLKAKKVGVTSQELMTEILQTPVGPKVKRVPNNLYNSIWTLVNRGEAVRHGKLIYSTQTYERIEAGEWTDPRFETGPTTEMEAIQNAIIATLKGSGMSLSAQQITDRLIADPAFAARHAENPKYFGSLLSKMVQRDLLDRQKRQYLLPEWKGAAPNEQSLLDSEDKN